METPANTQCHPDTPADDPTCNVSRTSPHEEQSNIMSHSLQPVVASCTEQPDVMSYHVNSLSLHPVPEPITSQRDVEENNLLSTGDVLASSFRVGFYISIFIVFIYTDSE